MVDAEYAKPNGSRADARGLRAEKACRHAGHHHKRRQAVEVRHCGADCISGNLRGGPLNRIRDWGIAEDTEVEGLVRELPDVFSIYDEVSAKGLLETGVKLIAMTGTQRRRRHASATWDEGLERN